jgi:hypothetical protein
LLTLDGAAAIARRDSPFCHDSVIEMLSQLTGPRVDAIARIMRYAAGAPQR